MGLEHERLLVLYASQTGNAMDVTERVWGEAGRGGCPSVEVLSMDAFDPHHLLAEHTVIVIVSTTDQGDAPDSMKAFWRLLLQRNLSHQWLEELQYAVFGLGDSSHQKYDESILYCVHMVLRATCAYGNMLVAFRGCHYVLSCLNCIESSIADMKVLLTLGCSFYGAS